MQSYVIVSDYGIQCGCWLAFKTSTWFQRCYPRMLSMLFGSIDFAVPVTWHFNDHNGPDHLNRFDNSNHKTLMVSQNIFVTILWLWDILVSMANKEYVWPKWFIYFKIFLPMSKYHFDAFRSNLLRTLGGDSFGNWKKGCEGWKWSL